jgi:glutamate-5-semialdehyde dehydrogenase
MMMLTTDQKNAILKSMVDHIESIRQELIANNTEELAAFAGGDKAMYDRLKVDDAKVDEMQQSLTDVLTKSDPIGNLIFTYDHPNGMQVENRTAPFGSILIIYESRPDVTIEAAAIAFKSGNRILLKGGKESRKSNLMLVECWHKALAEHAQSTDWIQYLDFDRTATQEFLRNPSQALDLIVPRGGDGLINFVKQHAVCPVLVSGRGNNFVYVHSEADWQKAESIIRNAKLTKISACNAVDKVLVDKDFPEFRERVSALMSGLMKEKVEVFANITSSNGSQPQPWDKEDILYEEFLDYKILIDQTDGIESAIHTINKYSGGHSATIVTEDKEAARLFMDSVDVAAVYQNVSTRFTDGGQMGLGAELAISTDKLHHRGPLGLDQLVTNKWYVYGDGQIRE